MAFNRASIFVVALSVQLAMATYEVPGLSVTSTTPDWESLIFWIPSGSGRLSIACRLFSRYYCLDSYQTLNPYTNETVAFQEAALDVDAARAWFTVLVKDNWKKINYVDLNAPNECCEYQTFKYLFNGLHNKEWSPQMYWDKLTNYHDETNKTLNHILAYGSKISCENIILTVGFGPGKLRRSHMDSIHEGAPYVVAGKEYFRVGNPHIETKRVSYENPGEELTFHWFKHQIMCRDNPWICEGEIRNPNRGEKKRSGKKGKGKRNKNNRT